MTQFIPISNPSSDLGPSNHLLSDVFPFLLAFDQDMKIAQLGFAMQKLYPALKVGLPIADYFQIKRPNITLEFNAVCQKSKALILMVCTIDGLRFRGQVIRHKKPDSGRENEKEKELVLLLISPWITSSSNLQTLETKLTGFKLQETIPDFLFLLQARSATLAETKQLAGKLTDQRIQLQRALHQSQLTTAALDQSTDAIEITDSQFRLLYVNTAFEKITGYSRAEVLGKTPAELFRGGQHDEAFYENISAQVTAGHMWRDTLLGRRKDGTLYHQDATIFPVRNANGRITNYIAIKRDISSYKQTQTKLQHSLSLLQATFEATAAGILVVDIRGRILNYNQKFVDLWQIPASVLDSKDYLQVMHFISQSLKEPECLPVKRIVEFLFTEPQSESRDIWELKDDRILEQYSCPQKIGETAIGWVYSFQDVTERQRTAEAMRYQALHDSLTGLPNRTLFNERLHEALTQAVSHQDQLAVMFLDLDRFKLINDTLGHAAGDQLLQEVTRRIQGCLRHNDTFARWAGDEFTLLLTDIRGVDDAVTVAQKILDALKPDYKLEGHSLHVSTSIGIATYPTDGEDAETLLKHADSALYRAKDGGRNGYHLYTQTPNSEASDWLALESHLHRALERQEFVIHYQPQVNVVTGEITQLEALLRWNHPQLGLVPPNRFIPIAEENGLIVSIGDWVLQTACAQCQAWQVADLPPVRVAVNLSARQIRQPHLVESVRQALTNTGLDPRYLELEITETAAMKNVERTTEILRELHQMGVSTAMDDFGTGYSSLSHLKDLPFHTLKIDQSFVRDLTTDANDKAIVAAIIAMGRVLKLRLVAEGVETVVQKHSLMSLDCEEMQGYLFSQPLPAEETTKLLNYHAANYRAMRA